MEINKKSIARNKLILLYLLHQIDHRLSEAQLLKIVSDHNFMDYFDLSQSLHEMVENHLLDQTNSINGVFYQISDLGRSTLQFFEKELVPSLRKKIARFVQEKKQDLVFETQLYSEYTQIGENQFRVILKLLEQDVPIFELSFLANSKEEADLYTKGWQRHATNVYKTIFKELLRNP